MKKILFYTVFAVGVVLGLANCNNRGSNNNQNGYYNAYGVYGTCENGMINSPHGCLQQCGPNSGWLNGQCVNVGNYVNTQCSTGQIFSPQYGCLQQCGTNSGYLNGQCVNVNNAYGYGYNNGACYNQSGYAYNCGSNYYQNPQYYRQPGYRTW